MPPLPVPGTVPDLVSTLLEVGLLCLAGLIGWWLRDYEDRKSLHELEKLLAEREAALGQVQLEAHTDCLTGLFNRRVFDEKLARRVSERRRRRSPVSLLMVDIDYFKQINDEFGHQVGDDVLRQFAQLLLTSVRELDIVTRYGGEEFAIILHATNLQEAAVVAERIRQTMEKQKWQTPSRKFLLTVSAGVAEIQPGDELDSVLQRADQALYAAKSQGRNRCFSHDGVAVLPIVIPPEVLQANGSSINWGGEKLTGDLSEFAPEQQPMPPTGKQSRI